MKKYLEYFPWLVLAQKKYLEYFPAYSWTHFEEHGKMNSKHELPLGPQYGIVTQFPKLGIY